MNTSFASFYPYTIDLDSDHPSFYHIETFDNGHVYRLHLVDTKINMVIDTLSLERKCSIDNVHFVWHNHKVIQSVFNRAHYSEDAPQDMLDTIQASMQANNQKTVVEFLHEHNDREDRIDEAMFNQALLAGRRISQEGV